MKDVSSLKKKLAGYSAMVGAVLAANHHVDAQVIYHDIVPDTFVTNANPIYDLDMNNDGIVDFWLDGHSVNPPRLYFNEGNFGLAHIGLDFTYLAALGNCRIISANPNPSYYFWQPSYTSANNFLNLMASYWSSGAGDNQWADYGIHKFAPIILHLTDGNHYGWIRMTHYPNVDTLFIEDYAYQAIPDSAILTGCPTSINSIPSSNLFNAYFENHHLILHFQQSPLPSRIILFNDVGVKLNEQAIAQSQLIMDVSNLAAGVYFVAVDDGEKRQVKKVVIE